MGLRIILTILMLLWTSGPSDAFETVSLKKYPHLSIPISNPVDLTKLPVGKTFQVNHPHFVLQFFFSEQEILGIIFKRDKKFPLYMRWCFFRSCEESPFDYTVVIAQPESAPFDRGYFSVGFPPQIQYEFQGLKFFTLK